MIRNEIQLGLLVIYGVVTLGVVVLFNLTETRMPGWLGVPLVVVGGVLIGWALWTDRPRRRS